MSHFFTPTWCLQWKREAGILDLHTGLHSDDVIRRGAGLTSPCHLTPMSAEPMAMMSSQCCWPPLLKKGTKSSVSFWNTVNPFCLNCRYLKLRNDRNTELFCKTFKTYFVSCEDDWTWIILFNVFYFHACSCLRGAADTFFKDMNL